MRHDTHFSLEEAREILDDVEPMVEELIEIRHELDAKGFDISTGSFTSSPSETEKREVLSRVERVQDLLEEIDETGALFKDPNFELGMIDFPHVSDGREVYLCWMYGEDDIKYWHPIETGMKGRQPLEEL